MKRRDIAPFLLLLLAMGVALLPAAASAQSNSSGAIAGTARDGTGAVLPGVTVEAASPALIEKVRVVVTDDQGNYKIVDLRPGVYTVTFTLPGFSTFRRAEVELTTAFTANVNAEMKVGAVTETVTVTGASPIVDVQNTRSQNVLSRQVLDTLPQAQTVMAFASVVVGTSIRTGSNDVGGNRGELFSSIQIHGSHVDDMRMMMDGMSFNKVSGGSDGGGGVRWYESNMLGTQEVVLQTGGSMETETGGVHVNFVPKEGGNRFKFTVLGNYTNSSLQNNNINADIRARGQNDPADAIYVYDTGLGFGGPIRADKLWYYAAVRSWGAAQHLGGATRGFFNATQSTLFYTPDFSRPAYRKTAQWDKNARLTWQATAKHKVNVSLYDQKGCTCFSQVEGKAPEAARYQEYDPNRVGQVTWSFPATSRLLFDAGWGLVYTKGTLTPEPGVGPHDISVTELSTGLVYRSITGAGSTYGNQEAYTRTERASMSYVTGSHALKVGTSVWHLRSKNTDNYLIDNISYTFRNQLPTQVTLWATPYNETTEMSPGVGLYASDQWTIKRFTFNGGVRWDHVNGHVLAAHRNASTFVPAADYPEVNDVPNWKDVTARAGVAFDVFGKGKTAIKASLGKYMVSTALTIPGQNSPVTQTVKSATRVWNDANKDFVPQESELGPLSSSTFGTQVITSRWSPDLLAGSGKRGYSWQGTLALQHELRPGLGINVGYYRTSYGNFTLSDNLSVAPADYSPYCVTGPADANLPGGGRERICGLFDISPAKFGQVNTLVVPSSTFGQQVENYNGIDVQTTWRFGQGGFFQGGFNTGRLVTDNCSTLPDSPQARFCHVVDSFSADNQVKLSMSFPLPWSLLVSGVYQNVQGVPITAQYVASNAEVAPTLGRNLGQCRGAATCTGTVLVDLIEPFTQFENRLQQMDVRLTRRIKVANGTLQLQFDVYNMLNAVAILTENNRFGAAWRQPTEIMGPRMFKFGAQFDF